MSGSKAKQLSSLFCSVAKKKSKNSSPKSVNPVIESLSEFLPLFNSSVQDSSKVKQTSKSSKQSSVVTGLSSNSTEESDKELLKSISSIFSDSVSGGKLKIQDLPASEAYEEVKSKENVLEIPWFSTKFSNRISDRRKGVSRDRKQRWIFKNTQNFRFNRLVAMCGEKLGAETTLQVFGKLGRETGVKEYNALIRLCIEKARSSEDEDAALDHIHNAYRLFKGMREQGFLMEEETYGPFLMYLIDMRMIDEFHFFTSVIKSEIDGAFPRLGYYEMLLWIRVKNDDKVKELCNSIRVDNDGNGIDAAGSYLLALCENDKKEELLQLLEIVDVTRISPLEFVPSIFKSLGRLLLEDHAEKTISAFKTSEIGAENISYFICNYVISMPNQLMMKVEDVILKFNSLHEKLDVTPSSKSFEKLIEYFCNSAEVHAALSVVYEICRLGLPLSSELFNPILQAVEKNCEFELVYSIYDVMCHHDLKPNGEMFRCMINLWVKTKDFEGAYNMLADMKILGMRPTANIYNSILAGYFRERNVHAALKIVDQMKSESVKPDSQTFSYLICNCESEEDIIKYYEELRNAEVQATKQVYMSLINAYANCGQFEKAKQVLGEQGIPVKNINEIKSVLVSVLASGGHLSDALEIYDEVQISGGHLEPKAIISLIENLHSEGDLDRMLQLLGELSDLDFWLDGCRRVVLYCIRHEHLSAVADLLKQIKDKDAAFANTVLEDVFCQISETVPTPLNLGLDLIKDCKKMLDIHPSRCSLDFLLRACMIAKDPHHAWLIWKEYEKADLPYNALTFLSMYKVLCDSREDKAARGMLKRMDKEDPHVRHLIKICGE